MKFKSACAGCYAGLSCGIRIEIFNLLQGKKQMCALDIAKRFKVSQPTVSHHLRYLKEAGILSSKRAGRKIFYFVNPKCGLACEVLG